MLVVSPIPAFNDNYIWMLHMYDSKDVIVVDPGDAKPVEDKLEQEQLNLAGILITHHHFDHTGGISELSRHRSIPIYGPENQSIEGITHALSDGDTIEILGYPVHIIATPGHTLDHISYYTEHGKNGCPTLFCGDTLFVAGCGRLFEGTPTQMHKSLSRLAQLPGDTNIYCAHEYTQSNLRFALEVEPDNTTLLSQITNTSLLRKKNKPTVPTTLKQELATNPFLRSDQPEVVRAASQRASLKNPTPVEVFSVIRKWKDNY